MKKKFKKWAIAFICVSLSCCVLFAASTYIFDPMLRYRTEDEGILSYYEYAEMYSNPGIATHYKYDAVHVGTSMIQNTDIDEINALENCDMIRCAYSGGTSYNMKRILDVAFSSGNNIKTVYWELDEFQLTANSQKPRYPLPDYLYSKNHFRDIEYLLNIDIFYHYTLKDIFYTLKGVKKDSMPRGITWVNDKFGKDIALSHVKKGTFQKEGDISSFDEAVNENMTVNILPLIEDHKDTRFVFFFPPFSVLYWYNTLCEGKFSANVHFLENVIEKLLSYENVCVYFFRNEYEITENLDNYKDYSHYSPEINSFISKSIHEKRDLLTTENYKDELMKFREHTLSYNFDDLFS